MRTSNGGAIYPLRRFATPLPKGEARARWKIRNSPTNRNLVTTGCSHPFRLCHYLSAIKRDPFPWYYPPKGICKPLYLFIGRFIVLYGHNGHLSCVYLFPLYFPTLSAFAQKKAILHTKMQVCTPKCKIPHKLLLVGRSKPKNDPNRKFHS